MNKQEFLVELRKGLSGFPKIEVEERLTFYSELIDDRVEDGGSEEAAVSEVGNVDEIISQIIADIPLTKIVKERITPKKKINALEIVLLTLGSPIWLSLLISALAVLLSVYVAIWTVTISLWAAEVSFVVGAFGGVVIGIWSICQGNELQGIVMLCAGSVLIGLSIFLFFGCRGATKGAILLTKKIALWIKSLFQRKENE